MALTDEEREQELIRYRNALPAFPEDNNVYVSTQGDDDTGDGSPAAPFATIGKALRGIDPAETLDLWIEHEGDSTLQFDYGRAAHLPRLYMHTWIREADPTTAQEG